MTASICSILLPQLPVVPSRLCAPGECTPIGYLTPAPRPTDPAAGASLFARAEGLAASQTLRDGRQCRA